MKRATLVAAMTGSALTLAVGGVAVAAGSGALADSSPAPSASASANGSGTEGRHGRGAGLAGVAGSVLHGEVVVAGSDGSGTRTLLVQNGAVTAISGRTVTVRSTDGFTITWTVTDTTRTARPVAGGSSGTGDISALAVGDDVRAIGGRSSDDAGTATVLLEKGAAGTRAKEDRHGKRGDGRQGSDGGSSPSPTPSSSASPSAGNSSLTG